MIEDKEPEFKFNARDCKHGRLARSCDRCDDEREIKILVSNLEEANKSILALSAENEKLKEGIEAFNQAAADDERHILNAHKYIAKLCSKLNLVSRYLNEGSMIKKDFVQLVGADFLKNIEEPLSPSTETERSEK